MARRGVHHQHAIHPASDLNGRQRGRGKEPQSAQSEVVKGTVAPLWRAMLFVPSSFGGLVWRPFRVLGLGCVVKLVCNGDG